MNNPHHIPCDKQMNYQSENAQGETINFTKADVVDKRMTHWLLANDEAVFPPKSEKVIEACANAVAKQFINYATTSEILGVPAHKPSNENLEALREIIETMVAMAEGTADANTIYLSSLNAGDGKSTTMAKSLPIIAEEYPEAGILICVSSLAEIASFLSEYKVGVRVKVGINEKAYFGVDGSVVLEEDFEHNHEANLLPLVELNKHISYENAPIIITTQQMLSRRSSFRDAFKEVPAYFFKGQPRRVKVWDESLEATQETEADVSAVESLTHLFNLLSKQANSMSIYFDNAKVSAVIGSVVKDLKALRTEEGEELGWRRFANYTVPDLWRAIEGSVEDLRANPKKSRDAFNDVVEGLTGQKDYKNALVALLRSSNKDITVSADKSQQTYLIYFQNVIHEDFLPALVLDASGTVRQTYNAYSDQEGTRKWNVVRLKTCKRNHSAITIHHKELSTSKSVWTDTQDYNPQASDEQLNTKQRNQKTQDTTIDFFVKTMKGLMNEPTLIVEKKQNPKSFPVSQSAILLTALEKAYPEEFKSFNYKVIYHGSSASKASNANRNRTVILQLCPFNQNPATTEARQRGFLKVSGSATIDKRKKTQFYYGELYHHAYQQIMRTNARNASNGKSGKCVVVSVGTRDAEFKGFYQGTFEQGGTTEKHLNATIHYDDEPLFRRSNNLTTVNQAKSQGALEKIELIVEYLKHNDVLRGKDLNALTGISKSASSWSKSQKSRLEARGVVYEKGFKLL